MSDAKVCSKCGDLRPMNDFAHRYKTAHGGGICKSCRFAENIALVAVSRVAGVTGKRLNIEKWSVLGCDLADFKKHIDRQLCMGMSWDNRKSWHVDHIIPLSTAKTEADAIALSHHTNLRPMWAKDNLTKGARITHLI